jgi:DsbC/DsbD-like thiol-disulfide interchange protein
MITELIYNEFLRFQSKKRTKTAQLYPHPTHCKSGRAIKKTTKGYKAPISLSITINNAEQIVNIVITPQVSLLSLLILYFLID